VQKVKTESCPNPKSTLLSKARQAFSNSSMRNRAISSVAIRWEQYREYPVITTEGARLVQMDKPERDIHDQVK
jgi:hypothetical protein